VSERPAAGFLTAALVAPLVLLCCLGPAGVVSLLGGFVAWLSGLNAAAVLGVTIAIGPLAYAILHARKTRLQRQTKL